MSKRTVRVQIKMDAHMKPWQAWLINHLLFRFTKHIGPVRNSVQLEWEKGPGSIE